MAKKKTVNPLVPLFFAGALATVFLPIIRVEIPPFGKKSWGVKDLVSSLPQAAAPEGKKSEAGAEVKVEPDFFEVVKKLVPKGAEGPSGGAKISPTFILALLVPVSLLVAYGSAAVGLVLGLLRQGGVLRTFSGIAVLSSGYALAGTYYLSKAAGRAMNEGMASVGEKFLGIFTKDVLPQIALAPETGLFALLAATALAFGALLLGKARA